MWAILKGFIEFVTILFMFCFVLFCFWLRDIWDRHSGARGPGIELTPPALKGEVLTTGNARDIPLNITSFWEKHFVGVLDKSLEIHHWAIHE